MTGELYGNAEGIYYTNDNVNIIIQKNANGFSVIGSLKWDTFGGSGYYKGEATWTIDITEVDVPY